MNEPFVSRSDPRRRTSSRRPAGALATARDGIGGLVIEAVALAIAVAVACGIAALLVAVV